ncbi:MAG: hypothetical protein M3527_05250 [Actinomycetota bacterium]|nr:hypothetical protein [Acidimicrobiia bacterium]MDQ3293840.1 hypothetical protein [Actinomycetota bacterium]
MEIGDAAALVIASTATFAVALLLWACVSLVGAVRDLRSAVRQLREEALPVIASMQATVAAAGEELDRVDTLLGAAETVSATVEGASKLAYSAFSSPVIKAVAFANGTGKAARRLKAGGGERG